MQRELRTKKKAGFTIFEVAMAAAVMAMAISTSLLVMGRAFASLDSARCISYASQIMQSEMEKMRLTNWDVVSAYPSLDAAPGELWEELAIPESFSTTGDVGSKMKMFRTAELKHAGMIQVTLKITWKTFDGRPMERTYTTYYGEKGLYDYFIA